jgi:lysophospholipase L1-like esterase
MIGVLSIVLAAALVLKAYEFHQDKLQREEWEVRHVEVQAEVDDVRMKIEELAEDKDALQAFLDENINIEEVINMEETSGTEETEPGNAEEAAQGDTEEAKPGNTEESNGQQEEENPQGAGSDALVVEDQGIVENIVAADENREGMESAVPIGENEQAIAQNGDAILIDIPEMALPQPPAGQADSVSDNSQEQAAPEGNISSGQTVVEPEQGTVSGNGEGVAENQLPEEETVSGNGEGATESQLPEEGTVSGNGEGTTEGRLPEEGTVSGNGEGATESQLPEEETVSGNGEGAVESQLPEEGTVSGNVTGDGYETISGNAVVDGKVIPFRYEDAQMTLEARRNIRSSYAETEQTNGEDRFIINNNTYDFSGMTIACLGDSITEGSNLDKMENYQQYSYPSVLKNILQAKEVYNLGIGGSSYGRYWDQAFVDRYKEIPKDTDIILVMGGTNDGFAASEKELGSLAEKKPKTFYGDVDELMRGLKADYPEAKIIFITPLPNVLHDYLRVQRNYLLPQKVFANAVKELAAQYDIDVIDLYNSNLLDTHDAQVISTYMPDGVHGNPAGYQILAEHLASRVIRIMEEDRASQNTVSGNQVEGQGIVVDESVSGNGAAETPQPGAVNGSETGNQPLQDGKWIEEEIKSEEERAMEAQQAEENAQKAAQEGMVVEPVPQESQTPAAEGQTEGMQDGSGNTEAEEPVREYEYGGEAIVIQ